MREALGSIPSTTRKERKKGRKEGRKKGRKEGSPSYKDSYMKDISEKRKQV
jgi:hypothetical protein